MGTGTFTGNDSHDYRYVQLGDIGGHVTTKHRHWTSFGGGSNDNPTVYVGFADPSMEIAQTTSSANRVIQLQHVSDSANAKYVRNTTAYDDPETVDPYIGVKYWRRTA